MTEKQIERVRLSIKKHRAILAAEKRKFGGFFDNRAIRYYIADLYMKIADYRGTIIYKRWFDKNFPDDIGSPLLSLHWSIAYYELGKIEEAKIYTIDTSFQNIYLHNFLLDREVNHIEMYEDGRDMFEFAQLISKEFGKEATDSYLDWLSKFMETDEYIVPMNKFIELSMLLKNEDNNDIRIKLHDQIRALEIANKNRNK